MSKFYLVCAPETKLQSMQIAFNLANLNTQSLSIMAIKPDHLKLDWLYQNINDYDYILINSPTTIEICLKALLKAKKAIFITVGAKSGEILQAQISNQVLFPITEVGAKATWDLIFTKIDLTNKKILIIKGDKGNNYIQHKFKMNQLNYTELVVYNRVITQIDHGLLKKNLENCLLQGIIITSSLLVKSLFMQVECHNYVNLLRQCRFITIDQKIAKVLKEFGALNVHVTPCANRNEIVNLIRKLDD